MTARSSPPRSSPVRHRPPPGPPHGLTACCSVGPDGRTWLVTGGHRHEIDLADRPLVAAFGLAGREPRPANPDLVSACRRVRRWPRLRCRAAVTRRRPVCRAGSVTCWCGARRKAPSGTTSCWPPGCRRYRRWSPRCCGRPAVARSVGPDGARRRPAVDELDVAGWPASAPRMLEPAEAPFVCWTWAGRRRAGERRAARLRCRCPPVASRRAGPGGRRRARGRRRGGRRRRRRAGPGHRTGRAPGAGPLWLVSATGVAYGVADAASAAALGIARAEPAPEAALRMLPRSVAGRGAGRAGRRTSFERRADARSPGSRSATQRPSWPSRR